MKELKKYFSRKSNFSLKERFNMMVTLLTCFFTGVLGENGKALQRILRKYMEMFLKIILLRCAPFPLLFSIP